MLTAACLLALSFAAPQNPHPVPLASLDLTKVHQDWGQPRKDRSVEGHPLAIAGRHFDSGLGTHANSSACVELGQGSTRFHAFVGVDDEVGKAPASIEFRIEGDGKVLWRSGVMHIADEAKEASVDVTGVERLLLIVSDADDGIDYDHADWAEATFTVSATAPKLIDVPQEPAVVLTPPPPPEPRLCGARIVGARPGHPFLFQIPATGERPITYSADGLPPGLTLDSATGRITGRVTDTGRYDVSLRAKNARGQDQRALRIEIGPTLALTPPMGWNSWNCFAQAVDDAKVRAAADAMVESGLSQHGWTYINIDDCWEDGRDENGMIRSNDKFPDMKALADYVHARGLKLGIYSSPGPKTCAGFEGSYQHEHNDAERYAEWGIDYLKYDWCSYGKIAPHPDLDALQKPYRVMRAALDDVDRDIVYSLCQYGMGDVWKWGADVGGNCWRTTGDITDSWASMSGIGFGQNGHEPYAGPGHWNDPDMLVVGQVGWGHLHPTRLRPEEQYTHISLWCLLSAPLLIGCDLSQLDPFTLNLLCNDEVLAVDQDPLGAQAARVAQDGGREVWSKPMADGSLAVGLFNRGGEATKVVARFQDLGLAGAQIVRDLWRQQDLGTFEGSFAAGVARHGVVLVRLRPVE